MFLFVYLFLTKTAGILILYQESTGLIITWVGRLYDAVFRLIAHPGPIVNA